MTTLSIRLPLAHFGAKVYCRHCIVGYKHVSLIISRLGYRVLVEEHNDVLQVPVHEMYPEVSADGCHTLKSLN